MSVTIAIGCSLLILNVLIFAGVYYQRDKTRLEVKSLQKQYQQRGMHQQVPFDPIKHAHYHLGHSQSANVIVDVENHDTGTLLMSNDVKSPHICSNTMQINTSCMTTKIPLGDNNYSTSNKNRGGGGNGGGGVGGENPLKTPQTFNRNNTSYNPGMMTLPKSGNLHHTINYTQATNNPSGGGGGGGGGRGDCMTLPRNLNTSSTLTTNNSSNTATSGNFLNNFY